jgi:hypothetical protein
VALCRQLEDTAMKQAIEKPVVLELSTDELQLIENGLKLLLVVEDDRIAIDELKKLLTRIEREIPAVPVA